MKTNLYDGILLDIDNTIYDYESANNAGIDALVCAIEDRFGINKNTVIEAYFQARSLVGTILIGTASSHNRMLYIQKICEIFEINPLEHALSLNKVFWDAYFNAMNLFDGVLEMCQRYAKNIVIVSDLTAEIQHKKIRKFGLEMLIDKIVTSEEAGVEKPHPFIFDISRKKFANKNNIIMIGDNYKKDILGANMAGIKAVFLNTNNDSVPLFNGLSVTHFSEILELI